MKKRLLWALCGMLILCLCVIGARTLVREPVIIGIIDTGISSRAIPSRNLLEGKNYLDPSLTTEDTYGHGTAVASVILDVFPQAQLVPLVSNAYESGKIRQVDNDVFAQMIVDAVDVYHCQIINISVGLILDKTSIREAVAYAEEKGVLIVASAGNDYATDGAFTYYPASYETVLAVGSINPERTAISDFSQRGEWVNVYAVGERVKTRTLSGDTREEKGTSYCAAKLTGQAGKILSKSSKVLTPEALRQKLIAKAKSLPDGTKYYT